MKKVRNLLVAAVAIVSLTTSAFADNFGVGVTGSLAQIGGNGKLTEGTTGTETEAENTGSANATAVVGSLFIEYTADALMGMTIGFDYIPGEADVNDKKLTRTDTTQGLLPDTTNDGNYTAQATLSDHMTVYVELPIHAGMYGKVGYTELDVDVTTTAVSGSTYNDKTADGIVYGFGYKNDFGTNGYYKVEGTVTDFDTVKTVSTTGDSVSADLDVTRATFALGYKF
tara:strand:+ start:137 stop:817 length:681 start_codon:yes stop_codon:yes gene_type:complete